MGKINYYAWLNGCGCKGGVRKITGSDSCDCDSILLDISKLHTDDEILQSEIDELSDKTETISGAVDNKLDISAYTPSDLSNYYTKSEVNGLVADKADTSALTQVNTALTEHTSDAAIHVTSSDKSTWNAKQNQLTAGTGISIQNDVISVTASSPSVDAYTKAESDALLSQKQNNLTAGSGISIQNDVISVTATSPTVDAYTKAESDAKFATITNFNSHSGDTNVHVTSSEKNTWNAKSDFSGNYNDLTNKPTIPAEQIQSDWNQTNTASKDFIKNKPTIPSIWTGTKAQYDAIAVKDINTIYLIQE